MAAGNVPINFRKSAEAAVASYDWTDIAAGSGLISFYLCATGASGATTYNLLTSEVYSEVIEMDTSLSQTQNFDTPQFNLTRIISGTAYLSCAGRISSDGSGSIQITAQLKKYDGTTETNISDAILSSIKTGADVREMYLIQIPCTTTLIKQGEVVRLTLTVTRMSNGIATTGLDPKNRDGTQITPSTMSTISTVSKLFIPFKIDL